jgi:hypothetical protein
MYTKKGGSLHAYTDLLFINLLTFIGLYLIFTDGLCTTI